MLFNHLKFLGIKNNYLVTECYPIAGTPVLGNFSISGISLKSKNDITLLFGYDDYAIVEQKITIDSNNTSSEINLEKLWAQKKIAALSHQYQKNKEEIEILGKKYGIITPNTSLIVLEDINDYIQYDIIPPTELRAEFDRIQKEQREKRLAQAKSNWDNIESYQNELSLWWNTNTKYIKKDPIPKVKPAKVVTNYTPNHANTRNIGRGNIYGIVYEQSGALPGATIRIKATNVQTQSDFDGQYSINAKKGDIIQIGFMGYQTKEFLVNNNGRYNVLMQPENKHLEEVVVTAYSKNMKKDMIHEEEEEEIVEKITLSGAVAGVKVSQNSSTVVSADTITINDKKNDDEDNVDNDREQMVGEINNWSTQTKVKSWNPDRIYLKAIAKVPQEKRYAIYLELREEQWNNPNFYFDMANYFYNNGDKEKALVIVSNIADLGLENHQLYKSLTYVFRQWEAYNDALYAAKQVAKWRDFEPQSHRDLALTLEDNKQYQAGFDELIKALDTKYFGNMSGHYEGIEDIILMDINRMVEQHKEIKTDLLDPKYLVKMPTAVRIILNWNQMDTDIDMHVIDPTNEECYYGHKSTQIGARFSKDFTQGYGPEQYLLRNAINGKYQIKTNFYGETALTENGPTTVMVEIYTTNKGITHRQLQTIQLGKVKQNENLAEITIN